METAAEGIIILDHPYNSTHTHGYANLRGRLPMKLAISMVLFIALMVSISCDFLGAGSVVFAQSPLEQLQGKGWVKTVLQCYSKPEEAQPKLDALSEVVKQSKLSATARKRLDSQISQLKSGLEELKQKPDKQQSKIEKYASSLLDNRQQTDDNFRADILLDALEFERADWNCAPFLEAVSIVYRINSSAKGEIHGHYKNMNKNLSAIDALLESNSNSDIPFYDSLCVWRARYLAEFKRDIDGALKLLKVKEVSLKPYEDYGFCYGEILAEQLQLAYLSGKKESFIESYKSLHDFCEPLARAKLFPEGRDLVGAHAPAYHRLALDYESSLVTLPILSGLARNSVTSSVNPQFMTIYFMTTLDLASDMGGERLDVQRQCRDSLERWLLSLNGWSPIEYEAGIRLAILKMSEDTAAGEEWMKAIINRINSAAEPTPLDDDMAEFFKFLTESLDEKDDATAKIIKSLSIRDRRFGLQGLASARTRILLLQSRNSKWLDSDRKLQLLNECSAGLSNGLSIPGSVERLECLKNIHDHYETLNATAQVEAVQSRIDDENRRRNKYSLKLISELEKRGGIEKITVSP